MLDDALVRRQAQLLAQRDAEIVALRRQHERVLAWWSSFFTLADDVDAKSDLRSTCDRWCELLLDELDFQAAAVLRLRGEVVEPESWPVHLGAAPAAIVDATLAGELRARGCGVVEGAAGPVAGLAGALGLESFLWCHLSPRAGIELVTIAGFDARAARFRGSFAEVDGEQFRLVTRYLEAVLRNVLLVQEVAQHDRLRQMLATVERQREELERRLATIVAQAETIRRLSTPVLELGDGVLVLPIVGALDAERGANMMESVLTRLVDGRGRGVIIDVTGVERLDVAAAESLTRVARAAALMGARCVLTGVRPAVATALVGAGVELAALRAFADLGAGLEHLREHGRASAR